MNSQLNPARNWYFLLEDLRRLQNRWERNGERLRQQGQPVWSSGVLFGIETGRQRIAECRSALPAELNSLLEAWERIGHLEETGSINAFTRGMDFGIRLVIGRVRRYLQMPASPKFPLAKPSQEVRPK